MTINQFRRWLYWLAKYLGDAQAITITRKDAVKRRVTRRIAGKAFGKTAMRGIGGMFR